MALVKLRDLRRDVTRQEGGKEDKAGGGGSVWSGVVVDVELIRDDRRRTGVGSTVIGVGGTEMVFGKEKCCSFCLGDCLDFFFGVSAMGALMQTAEEVEVARLPLFSYE